jgi:hypothetical protein
MGALYIHAGDATFDIKTESLNERKVYHITGDGKTAKGYEWFYKVHDIYQTYIDTETMLPSKFIRKVNEGGYKIYNYVTFNQDLQQAKTTKGLFSIPQCTQDVVSAIYFARSINYNDYQAGAKIPFTLFLDDSVYSVYVRYICKEQIKTKYGTFNTIKISPLLIHGTIFSGGEKMRVWITDDPNHIPVRIESPILIGSIKVDLMGFSTLRHPLSSLVRKNKGDEE